MRLYNEKTNQPIDLPASLTDLRGQQLTVWEIAEPSTPGRSGKVLAGSMTEPRTFYPGVFGCYIADAPREELS